MALATPKVSASPRVLRFARAEAGFDLAEAARRTDISADRLAEFESDEGEVEPTLGQLRKLAALYDRTLAFFLLPAPPPSDIPDVPDFRSLGDDGLSPAVRREIRKAGRRRSVLVEYESMDRWGLIDVGVDEVGTTETAALVRDRLGVSVDDQAAQPTQEAALRMWLRALERAGVAVFQMSRVRSDECRGFSVYHDVAPIIVLNGGEPPAARIFTLMHELCHLLLRDGGVCTVWNDQQTERRCNRFAAGLLMPDPAVRNVAFGEDAGHDVERVARRFQVSRDAAAIRLRELGLVTQDDVDVVRAETIDRIALAKAKQKATDGGPPHYRTHLRNLGDRYVTSVLDAYQDGRIDFADVTSFLEAKTGTVDRMAKEIESRGSGQ
jgi:Zn-dependent peptidase ImmA (M78 family)/transcriptional regulator with XRE-family HTH domain